MQELRSRIKSCLISAGLRGIGIDYDCLLSKERVVRNNGKDVFMIYQYPVTIPECLFINKRDRWDTYLVNSKIQTFNKICAERIKFTKVQIQSVPFQGNTTELILTFHKESII